MNLDPRLAQICDWARLSPSQTIHDIACDHGLVAVQLALATKHEYQAIYASDIAKKPLSRAKQLVEQYKKSLVLIPNLLLSDGVIQHPLKTNDLIIIAGLSAETITKIIFADSRLSAYDYSERIPCFMLLQCMQQVQQLRLILLQRNFSIIAETFIADKGRQHSLLLVSNIPYQAWPNHQAITRYKSNLKAAKLAAFLVDDVELSNWLGDLQLQLQVYRHSLSIDLLSKLEKGTNYRENLTIQLLETKANKLEIDSFFSRLVANLQIFYKQINNSAVGAKTNFHAVIEIIADLFYLNQTIKELPAIGLELAKELADLLLVAWLGIIPFSVSNINYIHRQANLDVDNQTKLLNYLINRATTNVCNVGNDKSIGHTSDGIKTIKQSHLQLEQLNYYQVATWQVYLASLKHQLNYLADKCKYTNALEKAVWQHLAKNTEVLFKWYPI